jgi:hypothetical protein
MNDQSTIKDLRHFQDKIAQKFKYKDWDAFSSEMEEQRHANGGLSRRLIQLTNLAWHTYHDYILQQTKDTFVEGVKAERSRVRKILKSHYPGAKMDSQTVLKVLHNNAPIPMPKTTIMCEWIPITSPNQCKAIKKGDVVRLKPITPKAVAYDPPGYEAKVIKVNHEHKCFTLDGFTHYYEYSDIIAYKKQ